MNTSDIVRRGQWLRQASRWLLGLTVAGSALAVGSVHTTVLCVVAAALVVAAILGWWGAEPMRARTSATILLLVGVALTGFTALQCMPMPVGLLTAIAPHNADVWARCLRPLGEPGPRLAPISLDPSATRVELLKGVAYLLAFVTALRVARRKDGVTFLSAAIVLTGLALALAAVLHPAFGEHRLFGVFEPRQPIPLRHIAPLLNPNHLASYLNIALCIALASALAPEPKVPRLVALAVVVVLGAVQIWVASRGGVVAMVVGTSLVFLLARSARSNRPHDRHLSLALGLSVFAGATMMVLSSDEVQGELLDADVSKLEIFTQAMRMVGAYPLFGAGRGSFQSSFAAFRGPFAHAVVQPGFGTFEYPENVIAQWITEWGVPVTVAALGAILWALRPRAALARSTNGTGAWAALVATAAHNLVDFNSEVPGVMLALVVAAAIVVGGTAGRAPIWRVERWSVSPNAVCVVSFFGAAVALTASWVSIGRLVSEDEDKAFALARTASTEDLKLFARTAMSRHPSEPYLPFVVAFGLARERPREAVPWIGAALERAPVYGPAHWLLARILGPRSAAQARLEYRLAIEQAPQLVDLIMVEAPARVGGYDDAVEIVPDGRMGTHVLAALVDAVSERLPSTRVRLDGLLEERDPSAAEPVARSAEDAVSDVEAGAVAPWCEASARSRCLHLALDGATKARDRNPTACLGFVLRARALAASGEAARGLDELEKAADTVNGRVSCLEQLATLAEAMKNRPVTERVLDKIVHAGCGEQKECAHNLAFVAQKEEASGNQHVALALYRRAYEQTADEAFLVEVARLASASGLHAEAAADYEVLSRRHPEESRWSAAARKEREAVLDESL